MQLSERAQPPPRPPAFTTRTRGRNLRHQFRQGWEAEGSARDLGRWDSRASLAAKDESELPLPPLSPSQRSSLPTHPSHAPQTRESAYPRFQAPLPTKPQAARGLPTRFAVVLPPPPDLGTSSPCEITALRLQYHRTFRSKRRPPLGRSTLRYLPLLPSSGIASVATRSRSPLSKAPPPARDPSPPHLNPTDSAATTRSIPFPRSRPPVNWTTFLHLFLEPPSPRSPLLFQIQTPPPPSNLRALSFAARPPPAYPLPPTPHQTTTFPALKPPRPPERSTTSGAGSSAQSRTALRTGEGTIGRVRPTRTSFSTRRLSGIQSRTTASPGPTRTRGGRAKRSTRTRKIRRPREDSTRASSTLSKSSHTSPGPDQRSAPPLPLPSPIATPSATPPPLPRLAKLARKKERAVRPTAPSSTSRPPAPRTSDAALEIPIPFDLPPRAPTRLLPAYQGPRRSISHRRMRGRSHFLRRECRRRRGRGRGRPFLARRGARVWRSEGAGRSRRRGSSSRERGRRSRSRGEGLSKEGRRTSAQRPSPRTLLFAKTQRPNSPLSTAPPRRRPPHPSPPLAPPPPSAPQLSALPPSHPLHPISMT